MRAFLRFWVDCAKIAARGNTSDANSWQWVFANPLWQSVGGAAGLVLGGFASHYWHGAPTISPDTPVGVFLGGFFGFAVTWLLFFVPRLLNAPVRRNAWQLERIAEVEGQLLRAPDSEVALRERQMAAQEAHTAAQEAQTEELRRQREAAHAENDPVHRALRAKQEESYRKLFGVGIKRADVRLSYVWDNETEPGSAGFYFKIFAVNLGPGDADLSEVIVDFHRNTPEVPAVFVSGKKRRIHTVFPTGMRRDVYTAQLPGGREGQRVSGVLYWTDAAGEWEHLFCLRIVVHRKLNEDFFTLDGAPPWNTVRPRMK